MLAADADAAAQLPQDEGRKQRRSKRVLPEGDQRFHQISRVERRDMPRLSQNFTNDW